MNISTYKVYQKHLIAFHNVDMYSYNFVLSVSKSDNIVQVGNADRAQTSTKGERV